MFSTTDGNRFAGRAAGLGATIFMLTAAAGESERTAPEFLRLFEIAEVPRSWYANLGVSDDEKAVIEVTYSSVYGERWIRSDRIVAEPVQ